MELVGLAALIAIIWKLVDVIKYAAGGNWSAVTTQVSVWASAIVVCLLAREADPFTNVGIMGTTFEHLDLAATILFALGLGSTASGVVDFKKAIDGSDSAAVPPLLGHHDDRYVEPVVTHTTVRSD